MSRYLARVIANEAKKAEEEKLAAQIPPADSAPPTESIPDTESIPPAKNEPDVNTAPPVVSNPPMESVPAVKTDPPTDSAPGVIVTPATKSKPAVKATPGAKKSKPVVQSVPGAEIIPPVESEGAGGYTRFNNYILDKVLRTLAPLQQVALLRLLRLSHGFGKKSCKVSMPSLASACNASETQVRIALKTLEARNHIVRGETDYDNPNQLERGVTYFVNFDLPGTKIVAPVKTAPGTDSAPIKEKALKENLLKAKHIEVGKSEYVGREVEPLTEEGRQAALIKLRTFDGPIEVLELNYTPEDWQWLNEQLKEEKQQGS